MLRERLIELIGMEDLNPNQFYIKTGLGNGFLNNVGETLRKPSLEKIQKAFPHWNIEYLINGIGEKFRITNNSGSSTHQMIVGDGNITNTGVISGNVSLSADQENKILKKRINELEEEVNELKNDKSILQEFVTFLQNKK